MSTNTVKLIVAAVGVVILAAIVATAFGQFMIKAGAPEYIAYLLTFGLAFLIGFFGIKPFLARYAD